MCYELSLSQGKGYDKPSPMVWYINNDSKIHIEKSKNGRDKLQPFKL